MRGLRIALVAALGALTVAGDVAWAAGKPDGAEGGKKYQPTPLPPALQSPGIVTGPGRVTPGFNCRPLCATHCNGLDCSGLNVSQCLRLRQDCRVTCISRC